jgi:hypothetical protein
MIHDLEHFNIYTEYIKNKPMQIVATPVCMFAILNPMIEKFGLCQTSIKEKTTEEAFLLMEDPDLIFLIDLFEPIYQKVVSSGEYNCISLVDAPYGVMARKSIASYFPKTVTSQFVSKLPLGLFLIETTRAMYEYIFKGNPLQNLMLTTASRSSLLEGIIAGRHAGLIDSFQYGQLSWPHEDGFDKVVFSKIEGNYNISFAFVYKKTNPPSPEQKKYIEGFARAFRFAFNTDEQ